MRHILVRYVRIVKYQMEMELDAYVQLANIQILPPGVYVNHVIRSKTADSRGVVGCQMLLRMIVCWKAQPGQTVQG